MSKVELRNCDLRLELCGKCLEKVVDQLRDSNTCMVNLEDYRLCLSSASDENGFKKNVGRSERNKGRLGFWKLVDEKLWNSNMLCCSSSIPQDCLEINGFFPHVLSGEIEPHSSSYNAYRGKFQIWGSVTMKLKISNSSRRIITSANNTVEKDGATPTDADADTDTDTSSPCPCGNPDCWGCEKDTDDTVWVPKTEEIESESESDSEDEEDSQDEEE